MINIQTLVRQNIKNLKPYTSARDEYSDGNANMVFLDANENPFNNGFNRYPDPQQMALKSELSKIKDVATNQILLGNGSDEIIDLMFRAFCEPNQDNVLVLPPTYGMYKVCADINAIATKSVVLNTDFQPDVENILATANSNTKLLFLCSPNNPTGNSFKIELIETLLLKFKGLVIIDEAYIDFSEQDSWLKRLEEFPNLVILQTFSKAYGMAGIRLGACYASKDITAILNTIKPPYNVNELTQQKALECIEDYSIISLQVEQLIQNRNMLITALKGIPFINIIYPTDSNFVLIKVDDATKRYQQLIDKSIVVRNRTAEPNCENCLRLTVGTKKENQDLIQALKSLV